MTPSVSLSLPLLLMAAGVFAVLATSRGRSVVMVCVLLGLVVGSGLWWDHADRQQARVNGRPPLTTSRLVEIGRCLPRHPEAPGVCLATPEAVVQR